MFRRQPCIGDIPSCTPPLLRLLAMLFVTAAYGLHDLDFIALKSQSVLGEESMKESEQGAVCEAAGKGKGVTADKAHGEENSQLGATGAASAAARLGLQQSRLHAFCLLEGVCDLLCARRGHHQHDRGSAADDQPQGPRLVRDAHGVLGVCRGDRKRIENTQQ